MCDEENFGACVGGCVEGSYVNMWKVQGSPTMVLNFWIRVMMTQSNSRIA